MIRKHYKEFRFEKINDEETAYWLGFIAADGCLNEFRPNCYRLTINLAVKDYSHLSKFSLWVTEENTCSINSSGQVYFSVCNQKICQNLISHGITPRKTFTFKTPILKKELERHFWRGVVDGDGWIAKNRAVLGLCGNEDTIDNFIGFIYKNCGILKEKRKNGNIYEVTYSGSENAKKVIKLLYTDSEIFLDRKKDLSLSILNKTYLKINKVNLTQQELLDLYKEKGTWKAVSNSLGIAPSNFTKIKRRLQLI